MKRVFLLILCITWMTVGTLASEEQVDTKEFIVIDSGDSFTVIAEPYEQSDGEGKSYSLGDLRIASGVEESAGLIASSWGRAKDIEIGIQFTVIKQEASARGFNADALTEVLVKKLQSKGIVIRSIQFSESAMIGKRRAVGRASTAGIQTIQVSTAEEFINAIGSDRIIEVAAGEYVLSAVADRQLEHVRWDPEFDGKTITIRNVNNLTIRGVSFKETSLVVNPRYVFVLNFENCTNLNLSKLTLGHTPEKGACTSGVIGAKNCSNVSIDNCDLFGCGTEGLTLEAVHTFNFSNSIIRDCSYGIMTITSCKDVSFDNAQFIRNKEYWGVQIRDTKAVDFEGCVFNQNRIAASLFDIVSSSEISVKKSTLDLNNVKNLSNNTASLRIE